MEGTDPFSRFRSYESNFNNEEYGVEDVEEEQDQGGRDETSHSDDLFGLPELKSPSRSRSSHNDKETVNRQSEEEEKDPATSYLDSASYGVESFGDKSNARLGDREGTEFEVPQRVAGIPFHAVKQVACGEYLTMLLLANGQVFIWGNGNPIPVPQKGFKKRVLQVACGHDHLCAITEQETNNLYTWGRNEYGQLGQGHRNVVIKPKAVTGFPKGTRIVYVSCGSNFTIAISMKSNVYSFGKNDKKQLGILDPVWKDEDSVLVPVRAESLSKLFTTTESDPVENILEYSRLMIDSGKEHSVSWVSTHGRLMHAEQQQRFRELSTRLSEVEHALKEAETTVERLRSDNKSKAAQLHLGSNGDVEHDGLDIPPAEQLSLASTNGTAIVASMEEPQSVGVKTAVDRQINRDQKIQELDRLLTAVKNRSYASGSKIARLQAVRLTKENEVESVRAMIKKTDKSVNEIWQVYDKMAEEMSENPDKVTSNSSTRQQRHAQIQQRLNDFQSNAVAGEKSVQELVGNLNNLQRDLGTVQDELESFSKEHELNVSIESVLKSFREERVRQIKRNFVETQISIIHDWIEIARQAMDELQKTSIETIATSVVESGTESGVMAPGVVQERRSGVQDLLDMSDERIDSIVSRARQQLGLNTDVSVDGGSEVNDAALELISVILAALQDNANVRKENNFFVSQLMGYAEQQAETLGRM